MRRRNFNCGRHNYNITPHFNHFDNIDNINNIDNIENIPNININNCNRPVRKYLEPVLVAKIYNQPIVEEIPYSSMSMTLDSTTNISEVYPNVMPLCEHFDFHENNLNLDNNPARKY